jgi:hypothetical protein
MSKYFLKYKESGEIAATNKKGGGLSFLFGAQCLIRARGAWGTARQNDKEVHPPFFLAAAISPLSLFFKKYFDIFFLK